MPENRLPFDIQEMGPLGKGGVSEVSRASVKAHSGETQEIALKAHRSIEAGTLEQIKLMKQQYEFLQQDPDFGKFVVDTYFIRAQKTSEDPPQAFLIQSLVEGKRIDELEDKDLYADKKLVAELLEFVKAAISMLEKTKDRPDLRPDFFGNQKQFLGNFLHNPRYSDNIMIADEPEKNGQRVRFVDSGTMLSHGHNDLGHRIRLPLGRPLQLLQLKRWQKRLEKELL